MALVFYWHPNNLIAQKLADCSGVKGFLYQNRPELDMKIMRLLGEAGYDLYSTFHTLIGSIGGQINERVELNPDVELDRHTLKLIKNNVAWSYCKVINGPRMSGVIGYCSSSGGNPYAMSDMQRAQAGITPVSFVPRPM
jgi:hypothetical protein